MELFILNTIYITKRYKEMEPVYKQVEDKLGENAGIEFLINFGIIKCGMHKFEEAEFYWLREFGKETTDITWYQLPIFTLIIDNILNNTKNYAKVEVLLGKLIQHPNLKIPSKETVDFLSKFIRFKKVFGKSEELGTYQLKLEQMKKLQEAIDDPLINTKNYTDVEALLEQVIQHIDLKVPSKATLDFLSKLVQFKKQLGKSEEANTYQLKAEQMKKMLKATGMRARDFD